MGQFFFAFFHELSHSHAKNEKKKFLPKIWSWNVWNVAQKRVKMNFRVKVLYIVRIVLPRAIYVCDIKKNLKLLFEIILKNLIFGHKRAQKFFFGIFDQNRALLPSSFYDNLTFCAKAKKSLEPNSRKPVN